MQLESYLQQKLERVFAGMEREWGNPAGIDPDSAAWPAMAGTVPTGHPELNQAIGLNGLPRGHIVELLGPEHCGKSTLALSLIAGAQAAGAVVALIDAAHQLDGATIHALGVCGEELLFSQPGDAEQALGIVEILVGSNVVDLVVVDAMSALVPRAELAAPVAATSGKGTALVLLNALRRLRPKVSRSHCCLLVIDQLRDRDEHAAGIPEITPGARTLSPFASLRLILRSISSSGDSAQVMTLKVAKNRLGPVLRQATIPWLPLCQ